MNKYLYPISLVTSFSLLYFQRVYLLAQIAVHDYDAASNYLIIKEIASFYFTNLFHHLSPSFYLFHVPIYLIFQDLLNPNFLSLEYFNAFLNLLSFYVLMLFFGKKLNLTTYQQLLFILFSASSSFMIYSSGCISISNLSLLFFIIFLGLYAKSFEKKKYWLWTMLVFALNFTINYKTLLFIPILFLIEYLQNNRKLTFKDWFLLPSFLVLIVIFYSALAYILDSGLGLNYLGRIYSMFFKMPNDYVSSSIQNIDWLYYLKYLFYYENILILPSLVFYVIQLRKLSYQKFKITISNFIFLVSIPYLLIGVFLPKAPRLLLFAYPFLYLMAFLGLKFLIKRQFLFVTVIILACIYNLWNAQRYIYQYAQKTNYPVLVDYLKENKIDKIISTTGINLAPFLPPQIQLEKAFTEKELLQKLKKREIKYILIDNYYLATNHEFEHLKKIKPVISFKEKMLLSPFLFLEHSEYTGFSFEKTQKLQQKAAKDTLQLRLIEYPNDDF